MTFKRITYYLAPSDEREFSVRLKEAFPHLRFRDGQKWHQSEDPHRDYIDDCTSGIAYIWNPDLFPAPPVSEAGGWCEGSSTYHVIQFLRSIPVRGQLRLGQMGASFDASSKPQKRYTEEVFRMLKRLQTHNLETLDVASNNSLGVGSSIVVGSGCAALVAQGSVLASPLGVLRRPVPVKAANAALNATALDRATR
jgi:hypothetical protein